MTRSGSILRRRAPWHAPCAVAALALCLPSVPLHAAEPSAEGPYHQAREAADQARAAEQGARRAFEEAQERLNKDPANAPPERYNKVKRERLDEAVGAREAWDEASAALDEAEEALAQASAARARQRGTPEGRRLAPRVNDGRRALELGERALVDCDREAFERARRRAVLAMQRLSQLADLWLVGTQGAARPDWGTAALEALNALAARWKALEARFEQDCGGKQAACRLPQTRVAEPGTEPPGTGPPGASMSSQSPLATDAACPGLEGRDQGPWLATIDGRAREQWGETKADARALGTQLGENERVVLFLVHRARLYDLAGQLAYWNQFLRGTGEVEPGSAVEAADRETLAEFVEAQLSGGDPDDVCAAHGQADSPGFREAREDLERELRKQAEAYEERAEAVRSAEMAVADANREVRERLDAYREEQARRRASPRSRSLGSGDGSARSSGGMTSRSEIMRRRRDQADLASQDPAFAAARAEQDRARDALSDARADLDTADRVIESNPLLGNRFDGRRLVDTLRAPEVDDATVDVELDNALHRHIRALCAEFRRIASLSSFHEVADELLHPAYGPLHEYTAAVLHQFCFKHAGTVLGQLGQVFLQHATKERLDEQGENIAYMAAGTGLLVFMAAGATILTAGGASPLVMSAFLFGTGAVDVGLAAHEAGALDRRLAEAEEAFGTRREAAGLGTLADSDALDDDAARLAQTRKDETASDVLFWVSAGGAVMDATDVALESYRRLGGLADAAGAAAEATDGAAAGARLRTADAGEDASTGRGADLFDSEAPTPAGAVAFETPDAARTANIVDGFPPRYQPTLSEIGELPKEVEDALKVISADPKKFNTLAKGGDVADDALLEAVGDLVGFEIVIDGVPTKLERPLGAGGFGVVFASEGGLAIRFASSRAGLEEAIEAAYDGLAGASDLARAEIPGVAFPEIFAVGTQGGRPRVFVSELVPSADLGTTPEQLVETLAGLADAGLVYYDAAERNLYRGGILDPDLLGVPTVAEGSRLGNRLGMHVNALDLSHPNVGFNNFSAALTPFEKGAREAALLDPNMVNLAMLGHAGIFELVVKAVDGKLVFSFADGKVSLEFLEANFPYSADFRRAVEALAPGELLTSVPSGARRPARASIRFSGAAVRAAGQAAQASFLPFGIGPFAFLTTAVPTCWAEVGEPVPGPDAEETEVPVALTDLERVAQALAGVEGVSVEARPQAEGTPPATRTADPRTPAEDGAPAPGPDAAEAAPAGEDAEPSGRRFGWLRLGPSYVGQFVDWDLGPDNETISAGGVQRVFQDTSQANDFSSDLSTGGVVFSIDVPALELPLMTLRPTLTFAVGGGDLTIDVDPADFSLEGDGLMLGAGASLEIGVPGCRWSGILDYGFGWMDLELDRDPCAPDAPGLVSCRAEADILYRSHSASAQLGYRVGPVRARGGVGYARGRIQNDTTVDRTFSMSGSTLMVRNRIDQELRRSVPEGIFGVDVALGPFAAQLDTRFNADDTSVFFTLTTALPF